jgi:hypothetical protein
MSTPAVLDPPIATVQLLRTGISTALQSLLPPEIRARTIAPFLASVNQWSTQISAMLDPSNNPTAANLVFSIRKELFTPPSFLHSTLGVPTSSLPSEFQGFLSLISLLIEAQKSDKDKVAPRVYFLSLYYCDPS